MIKTKTQHKCISDSESNKVKANIYQTQSGIWVKSGTSSQMYAFIYESCCPCKLSIYKWSKRGPVTIFTLLSMPSAITLHFLCRWLLSNSSLRVTHTPVLFIHLRLFHVHLYIVVLSTCWSGFLTRETHSLWTHWFWLNLKSTGY